MKLLSVGVILPFLHSMRAVFLGILLGRLVALGLRLGFRPADWGDVSFLATSMAFCVLEPAVRRRMGSLPAPRAWLLLPSSIRPLRERMAGSLPLNERVLRSADSIPWASFTALVKVRSASDNSRFCIASMHC